MSSPCDQRQTHSRPSWPTLTILAASAATPRMRSDGMRKYGNGRQPSRRRRGGRGEEQGGRTRMAAAQVAHERPRPSVPHLYRLVVAGRDDKVPVVLDRSHLSGRWKSATATVSKPHAVGEACRGGEKGRTRSVCPSRATPAEPHRQAHAPPPPAVHAVRSNVRPRPSRGSSRSICRTLESDEPETMYRLCDGKGAMSARCDGGPAERGEGRTDPSKSSDE